MSAAGRWIVGRWSDLYGPPPERPVSFVARADASGQVIAGSRLSEFFEGDDGRDAAYDLRDKLRRSSARDAAVFSAETRERAEQLLSGEGACHG